MARRFVESASVVEPSSAHAMLLRAREFDLASARSALALPVRVLHPSDASPWLMLADPRGFADDLAECLETR